MFCFVVSIFLSSNPPNKHGRIIRTLLLQCTMLFKQELLEQLLLELLEKEIHIWVSMIFLWTQQYVPVGWEQSGEMRDQVFKSSVGASMSVASTLLRRTLAHQPVEKFELDKEQRLVDFTGMIGVKGGRQGLTFLKIS